VPPLTPAKALRSDASIPTRRCSSRAPRVTGSTAVAMSEAPRSVAAAVEPQQVTMAAMAVMTMAVTVPSILPVPVPADGNQVAVVEIRDDDVPPPGWDQWVSMPAPAPEPPVGVLVMREDGREMSGRPTHGTEASSSRAALLPQATPRRIRGRTRSASMRRRPTSAKPRPSRHCVRNFAATAPRSTGR
jgi:hypothetical protein